MSGTERASRSRGLEIEACALQGRVTPGHVCSTTQVETVATVALVGAVVAAFAFTSLREQTNILVRARDAICGGDREFVYTTDGGGIPAWAFTPAADGDTRDVNFRNLAEHQDRGDDAGSRFRGLAFRRASSREFFLTGQEETLSDVGVAWT